MHYGGIAKGFLCVTGPLRHSLHNPIHPILRPQIFRRALATASQAPSAVTDSGSSHFATAQPHLHGSTLSAASSSVGIGNALAAVRKLRQRVKTQQAAVNKAAKLSTRHKNRKSAAKDGYVTKREAVSSVLSKISTCVPATSRRKVFVQLLTDAGKVETGYSSWSSIPAKARHTCRKVLATEFVAPEHERAFQSLYGEKFVDAKTADAKHVGDDSSTVLKAQEQLAYALALTRVAFAFRFPDKIEAGHRLPDVTALPSLLSTSTPLTESAELHIRVLHACGLNDADGGRFWNDCLHNAQPIAEEILMVIADCVKLMGGKAADISAFVKAMVDGIEPISTSLTLDSAGTGKSPQDVINTVAKSLADCRSGFKDYGAVNHWTHWLITKYFGSENAVPADGLQSLRAQSVESILTVAAEALTDFMPSPKVLSVPSVRERFLESSIVRSLLRIVAESMSGLEELRGVRRLFSPEDVASVRRLLDASSTDINSDLECMRSALERICKRGKASDLVSLSTLFHPHLMLPHLEGPERALLAEQRRVISHAAWVLRRTYGDHAHRGISALAVRQTEDLKSNQALYAQARTATLAMVHSSSSDTSVSAATAASESADNASIDTLLKEGSDELQYAAAVVGSNNYTQTVDGMRRLIAFLSLSLDARQRFEMRRIVNDLDQYRMRSSNLVMAALGLPPPEKEDTAAAAPNTTFTIRRALKICRDPKSVDAADVKLAVAALRHALAKWRFVDFTESDDAHSLLVQAKNLIPHRSRAAVYPVLVKFLGALRVSDIDTGLLGITEKPQVDTSKQTEWTRVLLRMQTNAAAKEASSTPPHSTRQESLAFARKLCSMLNTKDFGRLQKALAQYHRQIHRIRTLSKELAHAGSATQLIREAVALCAEATSRKSAKKYGIQDRETILSMLQAAESERFAVTVRMATTIFGPLAFALDDKFREMLQTGNLTPELLVRARHIALLQDAQLAIAEELLLDDEQSPQGMDVYDDMFPAGPSETEESVVVPEAEHDSGTSKKLSNVESSIKEVLLPLLEQVAHLKRSDKHAASTASKHTPAPSSTPAPATRFVGPWANDEEVKDRWNQVGVETSIRLFDATGEESGVEEEEAPGVALDDVLISVKKQPPPSRAYFQQAILAPMRLSAAAEGSFSDLFAAYTPCPRGVRRAAVSPFVQMDYSSTDDSTEMTPASVLEDVLEWAKPARLSRKVFISRLPFDTTLPELHRIMEHVGGPLERIELWRERAQFFEKQIEAQESAAESRAKWQEEHRKSLAKKPPTAEEEGKQAAQQAPKKRFYKVLDDRRRKYAAQSPLCAFAYFQSDDGFQRACAEHLRLFGVVLRSQSCRIEPALDRHVLHISNIPRGMTADALTLTLNSVLSPAHVNLRLTDKSRLRHGVLCNGDALVEFDSHIDALFASFMLRGTELNAGHPLVVGWAIDDEWKQARPRLPTYF